MKISIECGFRVGVIHEAAVLFWGSPRIKNDKTLPLLENLMQGGFIQEKKNAQTLVPSH
jgi:hypothetical protein